MFKAILVIFGAVFLATTSEAAALKTHLELVSSTPSIGTVQYIPLYDNAGKIISYIPKVAIINEVLDGKVAVSLKKHYDVVKSFQVGSNGLPKRSLGALNVRITVPADYSASLFKSINLTTMHNCEKDNGAKGKRVLFRNIINVSAMLKDSVGKDILIPVDTSFEAALGRCQVRHIITARNKNNKRRVLSKEKVVLTFVE